MTTTDSETIGASRRLFSILTMDAKDGNQYAYSVLKRAVLGNKGREPLTSSRPNADANDAATPDRPSKVVSITSEKYR